MSATAASTGLDRFLGRIGAVEAPFTITLPDGNRREVGGGPAKFSVALRNERAMKALKSLDEGNIAEAYLRGDMDLDGDMIAPFALRASLDDRHPLVAAWRFVQPALFGQVYTNRQAIGSHYNADPKLFLSFLDPVLPAYSQGVYENDEEPLSVALARKFDWCLEECRLGPGSRILEIGPGWGAFAGHALKAGVDFTGITNSEVSKAFLDDKLPAFGASFEIILKDLRV